MAINLSDIKDISTIAKPFVDPLISAFVKPQINKLSNWIKKKNLNTKASDGYFENKFEDYLIRTYQKLVSINVLVFPNQQINIESIYYPLTINSTRGNASKRLDKIDYSFIKSYQRLLISDTAGMGKSTLSKWIGLSLIKSETSIPILIELKRLKSTHKVIDEIFHQLDPIEKKFDREIILKFLELGNYTILFDGFDEIEYKEREEVIADLKDFISKAYNNIYFLTSRPDSALSSFGDFQMFHIRGLKEAESFALIKKYDAISNYGIASKLIEEIRNKPSQIKEFLINPFLISLLYKTYSFNKDIPSKKSTFYDEVYTALYKHHDLSKDGFERNKKSGLDIYDFRIVLKQLAFDTAKAVKVEYSYSELIKFLKEVNNECIGLDFKEVNYIEDLESNVPLFVKDGNLYKWAHKSIQDYFAAEFISSSSKKEEILTLIYKSNKDNYLNILDFLYELEYELFRKIIVLDIVIKFIDYCDKNIEFFNEDIKKSLVRERLAINYCIQYGMFWTKEDIDFDMAEDKFKKKIPNFNYRTITKRRLNKDKFLFIFLGVNFSHEIINILGKKSEPLFLDISKYQGIQQFNYELLTDNDPLVLDYNPNNIANLKSNFGVVNKFVISHGHENKISGKLYLLDYSKCQKMKKIIEKEIASKKSDVLEGI